MSEVRDIYPVQRSNDKIDIYSDPVVKIKDISPDVDKFGRDKLHVVLEGRSVDYSVSNAIRRTILDKIPIYAFHRKNIHVENDKSYMMYNNDMLYNQIETLPIFDVPNLFDLENPNLFLPDNISKKLFGSFVEEVVFEVDQADNANAKEDSKKQYFQIDLTINYKNTSETYKYLSTHDITLRIDGREVKSYLKKDPICIIVLKPNEELSLRAEASLGIQELNGIYAATTSVVSKEVTDDKFEIIYESIGQLDKYVIFNKACLILKKRLENLHAFIKKTYPEEPPLDTQVEIKLYGEDYTLGNLLGTALQKCPNVHIAGFAVKHTLIDVSIVKYLMESNSKVKPIKHLLDVISHLIKLYDMIGKKLHR